MEKLVFGFVEVSEVCGGYSLMLKNYYGTILLVKSLENLTPISLG